TEQPCGRGAGPPGPPPPPRNPEGDPHDGVRRRGEVLRRRPVRLDRTRGARPARWRRGRGPAARPAPRGPARPAPGSRQPQPGRGDRAERRRMTAPASVLVVGSSAAGLTTAEAPRRRGYRGKLTVLGAEKRLPYDRPSLSTQVLSGKWEPERTQLRPEAQLTSLDIEFVLGDPAAGLDVGERTVRTASG